MKIAVLSCGSLTDYVAAAQREAETHYPVFQLDRRFHVEPEQMKAHILQTVAQIPEEYDTILVAMGFCGGSWDGLMFDRTIVIPRVDDCISLLLHTDDEYHPNLKQMGHMYMTDKDPNEFSPQRLLDKLAETRSKEEANAIFHAWFDSYSHLDIVDTGMFDCYEESYVEAAQHHADMIGCELDFVPGSNRLLEKLLKGIWDEQFLVAKQGHRIAHKDFFD